MKNEALIKKVKKIKKNKRLLDTDLKALFFLHSLNIYSRGIDISGDNTLSNCVFIHYKILLEYDQMAPKIFKICRTEKPGNHINCSHCIVNLFKNDVMIIDGTDSF